MKVGKNESKEHYLKTIYTLGGESEYVSNKAIGEALKISPASVTEMLGKLSKFGYLDVIPYRGAKMTAKGIGACLSVIRNHRLWEVFLMEYLGYTWSDAHTDACQLEHSSSDRLIERLDTFLNHPKHCPHGATIPVPENGILMMNTTRLNRLTDMNVEDEIIIRQVVEEENLMNYIEKLGLKIDETYKIKEMGEYEGEIKLVKNRKILNLSYKAAQMIFVEKK